MTDTLDVSGAASLLMVHDNRVLDLASRGAIKGAKIGRAWVFRRSHLLEYLDDQVEAQTRRRRKEAQNPTKGAATGLSP